MSATACGPGGDLPPEVAVARHVAAAVGAEHSAVLVTAGPGYQGPARGSSPAVVALVDMTESVGEGPTHDVLRSGTALAVDDLRAATAGWPLLLATYRLPEELRAVVVLPLDGGPGGGGGATTPDDVVGLLVLARERPAPLSARAFTTAVRGAALLAAMVMARAEGDEVDVDLDDLLDPRVDVVPRALGVLAQTEGLSHAEARRHLQAAAFTAGATLHAAARRLLEEPG